MCFSQGRPQTFRPKWNCGKENSLGDRDVCYIQVRYNQVWYRNLLNAQRAATCELRDKERYHQGIYTSSTRWKTSNSCNCCSNKGSSSSSLSSLSTWTSVAMLTTSCTDNSFIDNRPRVLRTVRHPWHFFYLFHALRFETMLLCNYHGIIIVLSWYYHCMIMLLSCYYTASTRTNRLQPSTDSGRSKSQILCLSKASCSIKILVERGCQRSVRQVPRHSAYENSEHQSSQGVDHLASL